MQTLILKNSELENYKIKISFEKIDKGIVRLKHSSGLYNPKNECELDYGHIQVCDFLKTNVDKDTQNTITNLIAAAPELLDALECLLKSGEETNYAFFVKGSQKALAEAFAGQKELLKNARELIAKAKGDL